MSLSGSMPSSYLEVFPRHSHIATHRFGVTASCAVRHRALAKVSHAPKIAGPEITPSLHIVMPFSCHAEWWSHYYNNLCLQTPVFIRNGSFVCYDKTMQLTCCMIMQKFY